jgi:hypothetical protein
MKVLGLYRPALDRCGSSSVCCTLQTLVKWNIYAADFGHVNIYTTNFGSIFYATNFSHVLYLRCKLRLCYSPFNFSQEKIDKLQLLLLCKHWWSELFTLQTWFWNLLSPIGYKKNSQLNSKPVQYVRKVKICKQKAAVKWHFRCTYSVR